MDDKTKTPETKNEKDRNAKLSDDELDKVSGGSDHPHGRVATSLYWDPATQTYVSYNPH